MKKIVVLGAGLVGRTIALDLAGDYEVWSVDNRKESIDAFSNTGVTGILSDLTDRDALFKLLEPFDLVVGAVPGFMGFETVRRVAEAGKNMVDISFFPEDPFALNDVAERNGVTVVTDCGVAPGMGNIILGYHNRRMKVAAYECLVGGLPFVREWPFEYRAVFSPIDVIEEYVRPARFVRQGQVVTRPALSDPELIHFDEVGTLESWNSDGLRTLITTMPHIPDMIEKTLRYPGCIEYLRVLRESGFFSYEPVEINGHSIRPVDVTAKLLFPKWKLKPGEQEFTVMRIAISGDENGRRMTYHYDLFDRTDTATQTLSMARTTGYTCTAVARLVVEGKYTRRGISPPEYVGVEEDHFQFIMDYLQQRNVQYRVRTVEDR